MMRVKCTRCNIEEDISEDDVKLLAHVVKKYNPKPKPGDYMAVLSIIKGYCMNGEKHIYIFDESFDQDIADTLREYKDAVLLDAVRKDVMTKLEDHIKSLEANIKDLEKKKECAVAEKNAGDLLVDNIKLKFIKLTGTDDTEMWSKIGK